MLTVRSPLRLNYKNSKRSTTLPRAAIMADSPFAPDLTFSEVNKGWISSPITGLTKDEIWKQFVIKARQPDKYLPCVDVSYEDLPDGRIFRKMRIPPGAIPALPEGKSIVEYITLDEVNTTVIFAELDAERKPSGLQHHNILHTVEEGVFQIEYVDIRLPGGERSPLKAGEGAIRKTVHFARLDKA